MSWMLHGYKIDSDMIYFLESLKVEGYLSLKNREASIQNKNLHFLNKLEDVLKRNKINYSKRLLVKIKPSEQNFTKSDVKIITKNKKSIPRIEYSPFDGSKKIVFNMNFQRRHEIIVEFMNNKYPCEIKLTNNELNIESVFKSFGYLEIRFSNVKFLRFIDSYFNHKSKSDVIRLSKIVKTKKEFVAAAFSALIDAEGNLCHYQHFRKIRIRMKNQKYIIDWKKLLNEYDIHGRLDRDKRGLFCLTIEGWEDFNKIASLGVVFYHSKKFEMWCEILNSYKRNQISRNSASSFYVNKLYEINKPITAKDLSMILNKSKRVVSQHLQRLEKNNLVHVNKTKMPYLYIPKPLTFVKDGAQTK